jgi:glycosyltransferase involved in cell wall biosynthesis
VKPGRLNNDPSLTNGRVLVTFEFGSINGGENSFLAVVDALRGWGWKFTALVPDASPLSDRLSSDGITVVPFQQNFKDGTRTSQAERRTQVAEAIELTRPNLVHCNSLSMSRLCGPVCRSMNVPSLGYLRDIIKISRQAITDINQLDRIVAVSEATRSFHIKQGLSSDRSVTIHNGIDRQQFTASTLPTSSIRRELKLRDDSLLLLSCGQIGMRKGLDTLIEAFVNLVERDKTSDPPIHLLILGQRHSEKQEAIDYEKQLHQRVRSAGLNDRVHFLGRRSDVARIMQQATVLVHSARQEPLGRVLLEAASVGLPIVTTNVGGTAEILTLPEFVPNLVPPDDPNAMANAVETVVSDNDLRVRLSELLRQHAESSFSVDACARGLQKQYRQVMSLRHSAEFESS